MGENSLTWAKLAEYIGESLNGNLKTRGKEKRYDDKTWDLFLVSRFFYGCFQWYLKLYANQQFLG